MPQIVTVVVEAGLAEVTIDRPDGFKGHGAGNTVPPTGGISKASRGVLIIATASAPIVAAGSRAG